MVGVIEDIADVHGGLLVEVSTAEYCQNSLLRGTAPTGETAEHVEKVPVAEVDEQIWNDTEVPGGELTVTPNNPPTGVENNVSNTGEVYNPDVENPPTDVETITLEI